jgi:co-chaperonin GroES (HSP10)
MSDDEHDDESNQTDDEQEPLERLSRHVQPLGPRVLIRIKRGTDRLDSGLFLPKGAKDDHAEALLGEVVEVARTLPNVGSHVGSAPDAGEDEDDRDPPGDFGENVSGVPLGALVLVPKQRGIALPWDDSLRLIEVRHILAIVDEIRADELQ